MLTSSKLAPNQGHTEDRKLKRVSGLDAVAAREILTYAAQALEPADRTQRQAFGTLMPELFVLRNKGFSFEQLTSLLNESGFKLQPSTVRTYYNELLATRADECQKKMNEQLLLMAAIRKETQGVDVAKIAQKVAAIKEQERDAIASRVDAVFAVANAASTRPSPVMHAPRPAPRPAVAETTDPLSETDEPVSDNGSFGLLAQTKLPPTAVPAVGGSFFDLDDKPPVPKLDSSSNVSPASIDTDQAIGITGQMRCAVLSSDIPEMERRPGVPEEVYENGEMEHPAVQGLMLTRAERLYSASLEIIDPDGEVRIETLDEKRFRGKWTKPVKPLTSTTEGDFTKINPGVFRIPD